MHVTTNRPIEANGVGSGLLKIKLATSWSYIRNLFP